MSLKKRTDPVLEAPTQGEVWRRIIRGKPYPYTVQCREAASNLGPRHKWSDLPLRQPALHRVNVLHNLYL
uniref:Uncharacterized protein n=1 Tax=Arundo donax TaxID=35708 RepID=A0A0A9EPX4_ARUDO